MTVNPALLGTLVALQGAKLSQSERTTAVATGLALGASNLVAGFMVGRGAVAESSLSAEKTAHATLRADFERLEREHTASSEKLEPARKLAQALRELPENVRKQLPAADLEAFLTAFPVQGDDVTQRGEVERSPKSHPLAHVHP